jgi:periplasmic glucans biosynthesis protein
VIGHVPTARWWLLLIVVPFTVIPFPFVQAQTLVQPIQVDPAPAPSTLVASSPGPFGFEDVYALARGLAERPYRSSEERIPPYLRQLGYDQYRDIRFKPGRALWRDAHLPFEAQFFLAAYLFSRPVVVNEVGPRGIRPVRATADLFDIRPGRLPQGLPPGLEFAGFRLHQRTRQPSPQDEFVAFLGASYFRAAGNGQGYGLSARGIAVNTGDPGGEEFPAFTEFWLRTPTAASRGVTVYGLLDGPSVTGAYEFELAPGAPAHTDVTAAIFLRRPVALVGMAPFSTMFFHGPNTVRALGDFRPEVHDSDGLLIHSGTGEWLWRPLVNPPGTLVSSFSIPSPKGFGLMQRARNFADYQDLQARYDMRPSAWVVPKGDWGQGQVRLFEFPSDHEYADNVVAMWVPSRMPEPGAPLRLAYQILWGGEDGKLPPSPRGRTAATRVGEIRTGDGSGAGPLKLFILDFVGNGLAALPKSAIVDPVVTAGPGGKILEPHAQPNPVSGGWRVSFRVQFIGKSPVELRGFLRHGREALTETWSYLAPP